MAGQKHLLELAVDGGFFRNGGATGAEHFDAGLAAMVQLLRRWCLRLACGDSKLRRGGVVHQQQAALLVLQRDAVGQHSENIPQHPQLGLRGEFVRAWRRGSLQIWVGAVVHSR